MSDKIKARALKPTEKVRRGDFIRNAKGAIERCGECFHSFLAGNFETTVYRPSRSLPEESRVITPYQHKNRSPVNKWKPKKRL